MLNKIILSKKKNRKEGRKGEREGQRQGRRKGIEGWRVRKGRKDGKKEREYHYILRIVSMNYTESVLSVLTLY